jgi:uncharacterized membrane protein YcjF (UPF0283 family)
MVNRQSSPILNLYNKTIAEKIEAKSIIFLFRKVFFLLTLNKNKRRIICTAASESSLGEKCDNTNKGNKNNSERNLNLVNL